MGWAETAKKTEFQSPKAEFYKQFRPCPKKDSPIFFSTMISGSDNPSDSLSPETIAEFRIFAEQIAKEAGVRIAERFQSGSFSVQDKADGTPVTEADREAEEFLRKRITESYPEHGIIGEEFGSTGTENEFVWVIDPIDGTKSFVHGVPLFGTLIGVLHNRRPLLGVINQPIMNRMASGDNRTAWLNGQPIQIKGERLLSEATLLMTDPSDPILLGIGENYTAMLNEANVVRSWGDCFGYLSVISGFADVMIDPILSPWDLLPLLPILRGAGAVVSDFNGLSPDKGSSLVATTNRELHDQVLRGLTKTNPSE